MKQITILILLLLSLTTFGQENKLSEIEIQTKLDSIKSEGNLLYSLENASWNSTDIVKENKKNRKLIGGYLTYKYADTVKTVFLNKNEDKVVIEYLFVNNAKKPSTQKLNERDLNPTEIDLKTIKNNLNSQLADPKYGIEVPTGFSLNLITIPFDKKFKTYLITGSNKSGVLPFGNDYLFVTDNEGKILETKKFHSRLIAQYTSTEHGEMTISSHSHLKTNPFISATDICTFKLYSPGTKLEKFSVYSPAFGTYFEYNAKDDTLKKVDSPY